MQKLCVSCALCCFFGCGAKNRAADDATSADAIKTPATVEQAAKILDLSTFPLMDGAKPLELPQVANLFYLATGDVKTAFEFNRKALLAQGWKELPNSSVTDQSGSAMFSRSGFVVFVTVTPHGEPGSVQVRLLNQGNVKPGKLPVPPNAKPVYVGDSTAMYETEAAVPATVDACRNLFIAQGWVPYGDAGDSAVFKQNANLATATVSSAPAKGGKTTIQYTTQLISADIPAPPNVEELRYVDEPPELTFTTANQDAIVDFYSKTLATAGWKSTMDKMVDVDEKPTMIFRNAAKEMLTLAATGVLSGKHLFSVRFQSAAEIAERDRKRKEAAPKLRAAAEAKAAQEAKEAAEEEGVLFLEGNGTDDDDLREAGLERARGLIAASDDDADNLYIALSARAAKPDLFIVARASNEDAAKKLRLAGADRIVQPYQTAGRTMANLILRPQVTAFVDIVTTASGDDLRFEEIEVTAASGQGGKTIRHLDIRKETGALIVALRKRDGSFDTTPDPEAVLDVGDVLIAAGTEAELRLLEQIFASRQTVAQQ